MENRKRKVMKLSKAKAKEVFETLNKIWPDAHCELKYHNPFQLVVAVVLSAQTTDIAVNKSFGSFIDSNPTFDAPDLIEMGETNFRQVIKTIGLAPTKAKNCIRLAESIVSQFNSIVPRTRDELESLAGVGRKTANVVLNVLYGEPTMAVDTHVARVSVRIGLTSDTVNREIIEEELLAVVPHELAQNAHHTLIFHGRYLCKARNPLCSECKISHLCLRKGLD